MFGFVSNIFGFVWRILANIVVSGFQERAHLYAEQLVQKEIEIINSFSKFHQLAQKISHIDFPLCKKETQFPREKELRNNALGELDDISPFVENIVKSCILITFVPILVSIIIHILFVVFGAIKVSLFLPLFIVLFDILFCVFIIILGLLGIFEGSLFLSISIILLNIIFLGIALRKVLMLGLIRGLICGVIGSMVLFCINTVKLCGRLKGLSVLSKEYWYALTNTSEIFDAHLSSLSVIVSSKQLSDYNNFSDGEKLIVNNTAHLGDMLLDMCGQVLVSPVERKHKRIIIDLPDLNSVGIFNKTNYVMNALQEMPSPDIDERSIFLRINTDSFIHRQIIHERKDRQKYNERYTKEFLAAFDALIAKDYDTAKEHCKQLKHKCLKWLLFEEFDFYRRVYKIPAPTVVLFAPVFGVKAKKFEKFMQIVQNKLPKSKAFARNYAEFMSFKNSEETYKNLPIKHLVICAPMSAGKSTFVNALLGNDMLPSRNEATTAKITSVYNKDGMMNMIGFVRKQDDVAVDLCNDVQQETIESWNSSTDVSRIFLQGNFDGICNTRMIAAIHDTPGTNNSGDKGHRKVAFEFLTQNKMDAMIFVADATQLCTTDERALLSELFKKVVKPNEVPVIFVLNKADELDPEKEDIEQIKDKYRTYLSKIGFPAPAIFPLSAKAARLLKMARNGHTGMFTSREAREFAYIFSVFTTLHDFSTGTHNNNTETVEKVSIEKRDYPLSEICHALERTGDCRKWNLI